MNREWCKTDGDEIIGVWFFGFFWCVFQRSVRRISVNYKSNPAPDDDVSAYNKLYKQFEIMYISFLFFIIERVGLSLPFCFKFTR